MKKENLNKLLEAFDHGDVVALGRLLKEVENGTSAGYKALSFSSRKKRNAHVVGITGPPGAGKSTLVGQLCKIWEDRGLKLGVVCIDPSSPYNGGALLGDRIRMQELSKSPNVFIKSLATRGSLGGIASSTADVATVLDAFGKDIVIVETVGVGQVAFDILDVADTVVFVNVPGLGDSLQAEKAGIMEIADIYVINQADRPGSDESVKDVRMMIDQSEYDGWSPPVLKTVATQKIGIPELIEKIDSHKAHLMNSDLWNKKRRERDLKRLHNLIGELILARVNEYVSSSKIIEQRIANVRDGELNPFVVANDIVKEILGKKIEMGGN